MESTSVSVSESIFTSSINTRETVAISTQGSTNPPLKVDNVVNTDTMLIHGNSERRIEADNTIL